MLKMVRHYCLFLILLSASLCGESLPYLPVASKGRFLPLEVYAKHWLKQFYHQDQLDLKDAKNFNISDRSALSVLLDIHFHGIEPWTDFPLFWIGPQEELKAVLGLDQTITRLSYNQLQHLKVKTKLLTPETSEKLDKLFILIQHLEQQSTKVIPRIVKGGNYFFSTLLNADPILRLLPSKRENGEWLPIRALTFQIEDTQEEIRPIPNFTLYSDEQFNLIRSAYLNNKIPAELLLENYRSLAGSIYLEVSDKTMNYPTLNQLYAEVWYYRIPWLALTISAYLIAAIWVLVALWKRKEWCTKLSFLFFLLPVVLHAFVLGVRGYILGRPPVSNMYETMVYVPCIIALTSMGLYLHYRNQVILFVGALGAAIFLILLQFVTLNSALENVQPVLDSQYWLTVHVLLVVASYGVFAMSALLSHFYLLFRTISLRETASLKTLSKAVLQSLYVGVAFLIVGTILGGVWAAESWGRFWDWDPKESWAFISICTYLIWIHAYTFNYVNNIGLAIGAGIGFLAISFTWYGVNYILGTGLHSYGFGSGGEIYYYLFLFGDLSFLLITGLIAKWRSRRIPFVS